MRKLRHKTVAKFIRVYLLSREKKRRPKVQEVVQLLNCSESSAYNYLSTLEYLFGPTLA